MFAMKIYTCGIYGQFRFRPVSVFLLFSVYIVLDPLFFVEPACGERDIVVLISFRCMCVHACCVMHLSGFVRAIPSIFMHGFQNNLAQLFSLACRSAI